MQQVEVSAQGAKMRIKKIFKRIEIINLKGIVSYLLNSQVLIKELLELDNSELIINKIYRL